MQVQDINLPTKAEPFQTLTQDKFDRGVITLINESKLPQNALKEARNIMLVEDGSPRPRWGIDWFGTAASASAIDGGGIFETAAGAIHLLKVAGGKVWRSTNDGDTWSECTGATLTAGHKAKIEQGASYAFIGNGEDNIVRYDGTTTLQVYSSLSAPSAPTATKTGLAGTTYTYRYRISAVNAVGFTEASTAGTQTVGMTRDRWGSSDYMTVTWSSVAGATRYDIYVGTTAGEEVYLDSIPAVASPSYTDNGSVFENSNILAPDANTTLGPKVGDIESVGSRFWATRDKDNPYRVWWTGAGSYVGYFATSYDGGYIDLQKGSQFRPVKVEDYRDGKGTPFATVWCKSADGRGCIWQIGLESLTIDVTTITVPAAYKLPGSRGTNAPYSVVAVLNDYLYYNSQAFYNLGSRAQFLNLLSTDEASANIRPSVKQINSAASSNIAAVYYDAKVFFSVPYGSSATNDYTIVYDTERKAWLPEAFTQGFERFFSYTDTTGDMHLLAWKPGDSRFSQIGEGITGDYNEAYDTSLITGLNHIAKNRFEFMWVEEAEIEFAEPNGQINIELLGIERNRGFRGVSAATVTSRTSNVGWSTFLWSTTLWTDTSVIPQTYSESALKRYFNVQRELNAYQWHITSNDSLEIDFILRTLQLNGTPTQGGKPRQWRLTRQD